MKQVQVYNPNKSSQGLPGVGNFPPGTTTKVVTENQLEILKMNGALKTTVLKADKKAKINVKEELKEGKLKIITSDEKGNVKSKKSSIQESETSSKRTSGKSKKDDSKKKSKKTSKN